MAALTQSHRLAWLATPLGEDVLVLRSLHVTEQLGRLYTLEIEADSERGDLKADDLLGHPVYVEMNCPGGEGKRYFHGYVNFFSHAPRIGRRYFRYHLTAVPWLWFLTRQADCRISKQGATVPEILKDVFARTGLTAFEDNLHGSYDPMDYCVQYRETAFNFVSRLMEQFGIYYYFEHSPVDNVLMLVDSPDGHEPFPGYERVQLKARSGAHGQGDEVLREWQRAHRHHSGMYAHQDYNFQTPLVDLATRKNHFGDFGLEAYEIYDYPGEYRVYREGEARAKVRMEEIRAERVLFHTAGNVVGLAVGRRFSLKGPRGFADDGDYLVVASSIHLKTAVYQTGGGGEDDGEESYAVSATLMPAAEPFRAARLTPKPVIQGVQTAVVVGPKGEEIFTDDYGRVMVQFHWDREGKHDENSSCMIRVGQVWAGKRWGATFTPRIGQEVIVAFLEGDPDQPIVVGSVYNGDQMPPYLGGGRDDKHPNDPKVSGIKTMSTKGGAGFNELRFDDNKGKEQIFLHAQKDLDVRVNGSERVTIGGNVDITVGSEQGPAIVTAKVTDWVKMFVDQMMDLKAGNQIGLCAGDDGDALMNLGVGGYAIFETKKTFEVKTKKVLVTADEIHLSAGPSIIKLGPDGIYIKGPKVYINSGGDAEKSAGVGPVPFTAPAAADNSKPGFLSSPPPPPPPPPPSPPPKPPAPPGPKKSMSPADAQKFMDDFKKTDIPFDYPVDCCYARARQMCDIMGKQGYESEKLWSEGNLHPVKADGTPVRFPDEHGTSQDVSWHYHVAPIVNVTNPDGTTTPHILDPSLSDKPLTVDEWKKLTNSSVPTTDKVTPANEHYPFHPDYAGKDYTVAEAEAQSQQHRETRDRNLAAARTP